jgi:glycosyltransferase involved in cell wall biosynthesis
MPVATTTATVLLFTESYPYDIAQETTFIEPELPHLREVFDRVVLVPSRLGGELAAVPHGIETELGLAGYLSGRSSPRALVARAAWSTLTWRDLQERPLWTGWPRAIKRLIGTAARAEFTRDWVRTFLARERIAVRQCVAYTYWCDRVTAGLCLLKREWPQFVVVSRAHGHDLYPERHSPAYLPCRTETLRNLDRLYPDSERGVRYIAHHHPAFAPRCEVARMGVEDPGFTAVSSPAGQFVLVSCSNVIPVKRVDMILRAVDMAARARPGLRIEWHHIGDGPARAAIQERARATLPGNAVAEFHGRLAYSPVDFYRSRPIDAFVNASQSEGTPVSMMEAVSCGIPVIATDVGGNPEIVSQRNGILVSMEPSSLEFGGALLAMMDSPADAHDRARSSVDVWRNKYDAGTNYAAFARRLAALRESGTR